MLNMRPSPAIVVSADTQIGDAIRKMREHDVGSILVVREVKPHDLVGIFTERDLIHKIDEIQHGGYWTKGIASVMTKPVISVSVYELRKAPEIMSRCHIRHLPVVYLDESEQNHIVGVISMRDLFQSYYEAGVETALERSRKTPPKISLASKNDSNGMLRTILSQQGKAKIVEVDPEQLVDRLDAFVTQAKPDLLVVDLDFMSPVRWARFLQKVNHQKGLPGCVVLFTPNLHEEKNVRALSKLSGAERITAFAKPINVLSFLQWIEAILGPGPAQ